MRVDAKAEGIRQSMSWLHIWSGLILGWLLYAIFFTGTLSFFQNEITIWMKPELHQSLTHQSQAQQLQTGLAVLQKQSPDAGSWTVNLPLPRETTIELNVSDHPVTLDSRGGRGGQKTIIDSQTGQEIHPRETRGGMFLYRFHYELYALPNWLARWMVGIATMFMFVAIISGVITHKKIFKEFFTFRPGKGQRSWLDAHNMSAVLALPFYIMITFSGLILFMYSVMPWGISALFPGGRGEFPKAFTAQTQADGVDSPVEKQDVHLSQIIKSNLGHSNTHGHGGEGGRSRQGSGGRDQMGDGDQQSQARGQHEPNGQDTRGGRNDPAADGAWQGQARGQDDEDQNEHGPRQGQDARGGRDDQDGDYWQVQENDAEVTVKKVPLTNMLPIFQYAQSHWKNNRIRSVIINNPNTADSQIVLKAAYADSILERDRVPVLTFNGVTGKLISNNPAQNISVATGVYNTMTNLHEARTAGLYLRWVLFFSGVLGTLMIASGLILWLNKRAAKNSEKKSFGYRLVEILNIAAIIGLPLATAAYFYANRFISATAENRADLEIKTFFAVWCLSLIYSAVRSYRQAWLEQLVVASAAYCLIPVLNLLTGGRPLWSSIYEAQWVVASFDLICLVLGLIFIFAFMKTLKHKGIIRKSKMKQIKNEVNGEVIHG